jgi:predicted house-cleaning NTP pyrophosphatase (Maf/HAM1 superfamily)
MPTSLVLASGSASRSALLREAGFNQVEEFFRWYNFNGLVAVK